MPRLFVFAVLALPAVAGAACAQSASSGYYDSYRSADARANGDPRDALPSPQRQSDPGQWTPLPPYARDDQVDEGHSDDEAHRRDRARTAELNHHAYATRHDGPAESRHAAEEAQYRANLATHDHALQQYRDDQSRYADRIARWRARANACEAGNINACQEPE